MQRKGWPTTLCVIVFGFVHLVYHAHAVAFVLALLLGHPDMNAGCAIEGVARALDWAWGVAGLFFRPLRVLRGALIQKPGPGVNALVA
eukprot:7748470-Pyramimonas_sp.AAC.1